MGEVEHGRDSGDGPRVLEQDGDPEVDSQGEHLGRFDREVGAKSDVLHFLGGELLLGETEGMLVRAERPWPGWPVAGGGECAARGAEEDPSDPPRPYEAEDLRPDVVAG